MCLPGRETNIRNGWDAAARRCPRPEDDVRISLVDRIPDHLLRAQRYQVVGSCDDGFLAYDSERRPWRITGRVVEPLEAAHVNKAMVAAIDEAGMRLWPGGWTHAMPPAFGINRRTLSRDRIERNGLYPNQLAVIGDAARRPDAQAFGYLLSAVARACDDPQVGLNGVENLMSEVARVAISQRQRAWERPLPSEEPEEETAGLRM